MRWTVGTGWAAIFVGIAAWAGALTLLPSAVQTVFETAPMPGGGTELWRWVAELRWSGILLAALGLLVAVAGRVFAYRAAAVLAGLLLAIDSMLWQWAFTGAGALLLALAGGVLCAVVAARLAGAPDEGPGDVRIAAAAITAACCGPLLFIQGTPTVNVPFLPVVLTVLMVALPAGFVAFAFAAVGKSGLLMAALPVAYLGVLTTAESRPFDPFIGFVLVGPLTALVVALTLPRRAGLAFWSVIAAITALLPVVAFVGGLALGGLVSGLLFAIAGDDSPVDGISMVPGVAVLALWVAVAAQRRLVSQDVHVGVPQPSL